jgi:hypothetical protein
VNVRRLASLVSLFALIAFSSTGCGDPPKCAPGTLFVTLSFDSLAREADTLQLFAQVGDKSYSANVAYTGTGTTIQLEFAQGAYPGGKRIGLVVLALREGQELSRAVESELYIPFGCAAVNMSFDGPGDLSAAPDFALPPDMMCRRDGGCAPRDLAQPDDLDPGLDQ